MLYPLLFKPVFKDYIWGGRALAAFGKTLPSDGIVAESWEISSHPDGESIVANGAFAGQTLTALVNQLGEALVGNALPPEKVKKFPLLVKLIDARQSLSVQVHPDDAFAYKHEDGELGKSEMWYILSALPGAQLVYDVAPGTTRASFAEAIAAGRVQDCLNYVAVKAGDVIDIPAGMLHAIGEGIVLAEIQQNSNTTYRVYDFDRTDANGNTRPLHIEKSLDVIDFDTASHLGIVSPAPQKISDALIKTNLVSNDYFTVEKLELDGAMHEHADGSRFFIYVVLDGSGVITATNGADPITVAKGTSVLIPASLGSYEISGTLTALKAYVPTASLPE
ncbi:MAG: type I phosphomannose isomerase catalytic subunit [Clostridia bacterium]